MMKDTTTLCLSCLLAALVLALMDAKEQTRKLEETLPECAPLAGVCNDVSDTLLLNPFTQAQRDFLNSAPWWVGENTPDDDAAEEMPANEGDFEPEPEPEVKPEPEPEPEPVPEPEPEPVPEPEPEPEPEVPAVEESEWPAPAGNQAAIEVPMTIQLYLPSELSPVERCMKSIPKSYTFELDSPIEITYTVPAAPRIPDAIPESSDEPALAEDTMEPARVELETGPVHVQCKVMLMGDSLMESLGPRFYQEYKNRTGLQFVLAAKFSTGLTRPNYFNWPAHLQTLMQQHKPDVLIVLMGANDAMPIRLSNGRSVYVTQDGWQQGYTEKMREIRDIATRHNCQVLWFGLPIFGSKYANVLHIVETTQEKACVELGIPFVNNYKVLADSDGNFQSFGPGINGRNARLRLKDKEHMTREGDALLIRNSSPLFEEWLKQYARAHPDRCLSQEQRDQYRKPSLHCQTLRK